MEEEGVVNMQLEHIIIFPILQASVTGTNTSSLHHISVLFLFVSVFNYPSVFNNLSIVIKVSKY